MFDMEMHEANSELTLSALEDHFKLLEDFEKLEKDAQEIIIRSNEEFIFPDNRIQNYPKNFFKEAPRELQLTGYECYETSIVGKTLRGNFQFFLRYRNIPIDTSVQKNNKKHFVLKEIPLKCCSHWELNFFRSTMRMSTREFLFKKFLEKIKLKNCNFMEQIDQEILYQKSDWSEDITENIDFYKRRFEILKFFYNCMEESNEKILCDICGNVLQLKSILDFPFVAVAKCANGCNSQLIKTKGK